MQEIQELQELQELQEIQEVRARTTGTARRIGMEKVEEVGKEYEVQEVKDKLL